MSYPRKPVVRGAAPTAQELATLEQYRPLVEQIANGIASRVPKSVLRDDLVAAGMGGLWDAIRRHKQETTGGQFRWYASVRIRGAIKDEMRSEDWLPRRSRQALNRTYDNAAVRPRMVVGYDDLPEGELDRALSTDADSNRLDAERASRVIAAAVDRLPPREREIVRRYFLEGVKLKDVACEFGVSAPRISQLLRVALDRLRAGSLRAELTE